MYHHIGDPPPGVRGHEIELWVGREAFAAQMAYVGKAGYQVVSAGELAAGFQRERGLPRKPLVLTFDDGYEDFYTQAWPVLREHGLTATIFVCSGIVGRAGHLTWDQLRQLVAAGIEVGSHGVTHRPLTTMTPAGVRRELVDSKRTIQDQIRAPVRVFSFPTGRHNRHVVLAVELAGYDAAVTTDMGVVQRTSHPYELKRTRVRRDHTLATFKTRVRSAWPGS